jgi:hypothetical protein
MSSWAAAMTEPLIATVGQTGHPDRPEELAGTLRTIVDRQEARMDFQPLVATWNRNHCPSRVRRHFSTGGTKGNAAGG